MVTVEPSRGVTAELRAAWRRRRLSLRGLTGSDRVLVVVGLAVLTGGAALLLAQSTGRLRLPPIRSDSFYGDEMSPVLVVGLLLGLAGTAAMAARAAGPLPRGRRLALLGLLAVFEASLAGQVLRLADLLPALYTRVDGPAVAGVRVAAGLGIALVAVGFAVAVPVRDRGLAVPALFAAPYLVLLAAWTGLGLTGPELAGSLDPRFAPAMPVGRLVEAPLQMHVLSAAGMAMVMTLWQAAAGARAARDASAVGALVLPRALERVRRARPTGRRTALSWAVVTLLGVKLAWVGLGVAGGLPTWLAGGSTAWVGVRGDGALSWTLAGLAAVAVGVWLGRGTPGPRDEAPMLAAGAAIVFALAAPELLFQALALLFTTGVGDWTADAARLVEHLQAWGPVVVAVAAAVAAAALARTRRWPAAVLLLALFAAWVGPRVPLLVADLVRYPWYPWTFAMPGEDDGQRPGWVDPASLDAALTAVLLVLAAYAALRQDRRTVVAVLVVGLAGTLLAHGSLLWQLLVIPAVGAYAAFVSPVAYQLLFDAEQLNTPGPRRAGRVLALLALAAFGLTVGVLRGARGAPAAANDLTMAGALLPVPVLAAAVVTLLSRRARSAQRGDGDRVDPPGEPVGVDPQPAEDRPGQPVR
jgi:hypothetical protein